MKSINHFCLSSYLAFRYVAKDNIEWIKGIKPEYPKTLEDIQMTVSSSDEILSTLQLLINKIPDLNTTALFLSGGIDSAILAALLPKGSKTYTIDFVAKRSANEKEKAKRYADVLGLENIVINVSWDDYTQYEDRLMVNKKAPLHAVEVALYKAGLQAKKDGIKTILLGNGADSTFGGLDKLLIKDWAYADFIKRYNFIDPEKVLINPVSILEIYAPYRQGDSIDFMNFLKYVHGSGIIQAFENGIFSAGLKMELPYEMMKLKGKLDLTRIRKGEPKYMLVEVFKRLYPSIDPPTKVAFARPMDEWLLNYKGPKHPVFRKDIELSGLSGDQKYLIHCLDKFLGMLEAGEICR